MSVGVRRQMIFVKAESAIRQIVEVAFQTIGDAAECDVMPRNFVGENKFYFKALFPRLKFG